MSAFVSQALPSSPARHNAARKSAACPPRCVANPVRAPRAAVRVTPSVSAAPSTLASRVEALPPAEGDIMVELLSPHKVSAKGDMVVVNRAGKRASFRIYEHVAREHGGVFGKAAARDALNVYGDIVFEAMSEKGSHPAIDWLLELVGSDKEFVVKIDGKYVAGR